MTDQDRKAMHEAAGEYDRPIKLTKTGAVTTDWSEGFCEGFVAALAHARKQTAELVEAVERYNRCPLDAHDRPESWDAIADIQAAAAQLKEQDDD